MPEVQILHLKKEAIYFILSKSFQSALYRLCGLVRGCGCLFLDGDFVFSARRDHQPEGDGYGCAYERADHHNPEIRPCVGREKRRSETARRVDRAVVDRNADDVHESEPDTYGESGKLTEPLFSICRSQNDEDKEHGEQNLGEESHALAYTGLTHVGGEIVAGIGRYASVSESLAAHVEEPEKEGGTDSGPEQLGHHIEAEILEAHAAGKKHAERHGRIDVAA